MSRYSLQDKVVLITGAAGGIGAATARQLYHRGATLVLTDFNAQAVDDLASEFAADRVITARLNVTDLDASRQVVADAVATFGRLDIVMANAGIAWRDRPATLLSCDEAEFEQIVEVDFLGVWRTIKAALPEIIRQQGQVLVTSSIYALLNGVANAPYAASKAGVESLTRSLRAELNGTGASASVIYPGWTATAIIDIAFGGNALATQMNNTALPAFLRHPIPPAQLADAIVKGIEKRRPRIIAPARWVPIFRLRGLFNPLTDRLLADHGKLANLLRQLEALPAPHKIATIKSVGKDHNTGASHE